MKTGASCHPVGIQCGDFPRFICLVLRFLFCCFLFITLAFFFFDHAAEPEGSWFLVLPGIESVPPAVKAWHLNRWDSRGVPQASPNES